eukprot:343940-Chlamydomonas_euryale.AAC.3
MACKQKAETAFLDAPGKPVLSSQHPTPSPLPPPICWKRSTSFPQLAQPLRSSRAKSSSRRTRCGAAGRAGERGPFSRTDCRAAL